MCKNNHHHERRLDDATLEIIKALAHPSCDSAPVAELEFGNGWKILIRAYGASRFAFEITADKSRKDIPYPMTLDEFAPELLEKWVMEKELVDEKMLEEIVVKAGNMRRWHGKDIANYYRRKREEEDHIR